MQFDYNSDKGYIVDVENWKSNFYEIFADSFTARHFPDYQYKTMFVIPDSPALDIKLTEEQGNELIKCYSQEFAKRLMADTEE